MDHLIADDLSVLQRRVEVRNVLSEVVDDINEWWHQNEAARSRLQALELKRVSVTLAKRVQSLQEEKRSLQGDLNGIKERAKEVCAKFAVDVASVLIESRSIQSLKHKVKDLEMKLATRPVIEVTVADKVDAEADAPAPIAATTTTTLSSASAAAAAALHPGPDCPPTPQAPSSADETAAPLPEPTNATSPPAAPSRLPCIMSDVNDAVLLAVFSYLQTGEVLAAAQVNRFVFQRVDGLFGIDSKIAMPAWGERYPQQSLSGGSGSGTDGGAEQMPVGDASGNAGSNTGAALGTAASLPRTSAAASFAAGTISALASMATDAQASSKEKIKDLLSFIEGSSGGAHPSALLLPREALDSLGKKLSAAEMKAVAALNDGLRKQIADATRTSADKDDLVAKLHNTETVRDFLVNKLRAAELALKATMSDAAQLRRQSLADAEVISYLDLRGQELEAQAHDVEHIRQRLQASLTIQQGTAAHTERRLSRELAEARARVESSEASHKAQKKLLVKEVKSLRGQLDVTTKERNVFGAQLRVVKDALL